MCLRVFPSGILSARGTKKFKTALMGVRYILEHTKLKDCRLVSRLVAILRKKNRLGHLIFFLLFYISDIY